MKKIAIGCAGLVAIKELVQEKVSGLLKQVPALSIGKAVVGAVGTQLKDEFGQ